MTVRQLIAKLNSFPPDAEVVGQAHDSPGESGGPLDRVTLELNDLGIVADDAGDVLVLGDVLVMHFARTESIEAA